MNILDKWEHKYRRFGIPNLTLIMVVCYTLGFLLNRTAPSLLEWLTLEPSMILRGQIWRLITWVLIPQSSSSFLMMILVLIAFYSLGNVLERNWGDFRYTLFIGTGILFTVIGAFLLYFVLGADSRLMLGGIFSTYYISMSVFLAFAISYSDMSVMLWFVLPIKVKYVAFVTVAILAYDAFTDIRMGAWFLIIPMVASLLNVIILFIMTRNLNRVNPKEIRRRQEFKRAVSQGQARRENITKHKCAICGRTELDDPSLEFRFCSRCNGNYEYCQDHLFTHQHVK